MLSFTDLLARFDPPKQQGHNWRTRCPAHEDTAPSLDIAEGDRGPVFVCRSAHCAAVDILAAVGLTWADVLPERRERGWEHVHTYRARDGRAVSETRRNGTGSAKKISQWAPNGDGQWHAGLGDAPRVPYRLHEIRTVHVVVTEGEKDADACWRVGVPATTNLGGAGNWKDTDASALHAAGVREVCILPDFDEPGRKHAAKVAESLKRAGIASRIVDLDGLPDKGGAADWLETHSGDDLEALAFPPPPGLDEATLADACAVIAEGQAIAEQGIRYLVDQLVPGYGMLGLLVAYAKVGKTTLGQALAAAVATGEPFLGLETKRARVLVIAAEDPPEYTAYLARHLRVPPGVLTFARGPVRLNADGLARISQTITAGRYGFVLIASWQAVVAGLVEDENDNAGAVEIVESVKQAARATGIPWLIDAHSGKGEDQSDEADPTKAMRGASGAAGAADYLLSLRYADGPFSPTRRLSGKGRFVNLEPLSLTYELATGTYQASGAVRSALVDSTWRLILESSAIGPDWVSVTTIAVRAGMGETPRDVTGACRRKVTDALKGRLGIDRQTVQLKGREITQYRQSETVAPVSGGDVGATWGD